MFGVKVSAPLPALALAAALWLGVSRSEAEDRDDMPWPPSPVAEWLPGRLETFSGGDAAAGTWFGYGGAVVGLTGPLAGEGLRLRLMAGHGSYRTVTRHAPLTGRSTTLHLGERSGAEIMLGEQRHHGPLWLKTYVGVSYDAHRLTSDPAAGDAPGDGRTGVKGLIEAWLDMSDRAWLSADAAYGSADDGYRTLLRQGYRLDDLITLGAEQAAFGDRAYDAARLGAFVRLHWQDSEITLSGGLSGDHWTTSGGYGTLGIYRRF